MILMLTPPYLSHVLKRKLILAEEQRVVLQIMLASNYKTSSPSLVFDVDVFMCANVVNESYSENA